MNDTQELVVSKLDAARRQLETAVLLYFYESDPVSIHTLTAAAYELLRGIDKARAGRGMIVKNLLLDLIPPDRVKEVRGKIGEAQNFFKHADQDPGGVLKFRPLQTDLLLLDACVKYRDLSGEVMGRAILALCGLAPEQLRGEPVDHRADLFAIGAILYEIVAGRSPFRRPSGPETLAAILREAPRRSKRLRGSLPAWRRVPLFGRQARLTSWRPGTSGSVTWRPSWRIGWTTSLIDTDCSSAPSGRVRVCCAPRLLRMVKMSRASAARRPGDSARMLRSMVRVCPGSPAGRVTSILTDSPGHGRHSRTRTSACSGWWTTGIP